MTSPAAPRRCSARPGYSSFSCSQAASRGAARLVSDAVVLSFPRRAQLEGRRRKPDLRLLQHVGLGVSIRAASSYAWGVGFWEPRVTARGLAKAGKLRLGTTVYT